MIISLPICNFDFMGCLLLNSLHVRCGSMIFFFLCSILKKKYNTFLLSYLVILSFWSNSNRISDRFLQVHPNKHPRVNGSVLESVRNERMYGRKINPRTERVFFLINFASSCSPFVVYKRIWYHILGWTSHCPSDQTSAACDLFPFLPLSFLLFIYIYISYIFVIFFLSISHMTS